MTVFGIPPFRLVVYVALAAALVALNFVRYGGDAVVSPGSGPVPVASDLPDLPDLAVAGDFGGPTDVTGRNLFRAGGAEPPPPEPEPEPERPAPPPPDPDAAARAQAQRLLDSVGVIGFLSTAEGVMVVLNLGSRVVNAFEGDRPAPGFVVSDVTIDSVTLRHPGLELSRTYRLEDGD